MSDVGLTTGQPTARNPDSGLANNRDIESGNAHTTSDSQDNASNYGAGTLFWKVLLLVVLFWIWLPVCFFMESIARPCIVLVNCILKNSNNTTKFLVLILIAFFTIYIFFFVFFVFAFFQIPVNVISYCRPGPIFGSLHKLFYGKTHALAEGVEGFIEGLKIGETNPHHAI